MFLAKIIEEQKDKYSDVQGFVDDLKLMPKAVRGTIVISLWA